MHLQTVDQKHMAVVFAGQSRQTKLFRLKRRWGCCCDCPCWAWSFQYLIKETTFALFHILDNPQTSSLAKKKKEEKRETEKNKTQLINAQDRGASRNQVNWWSTSKQITAQCAIQIEERHDVGYMLKMPACVFPPLSFVYSFLLPKPIYSFVFETCTILTISWLFMLELIRTGKLGFSHSIPMLLSYLKYFINNIKCTKWLHLHQLFTCSFFFLYFSRQISRLHFTVNYK